jgi:hypothetical protein
LVCEGGFRLSCQIDEGFAADVDHHAEACERH